MKKCKIAQHTTESMHIRHDDILPLVNNRAKDRPYELNKLKLKLANYQDNKRYKEVKRLTRIGANKSEQGGASVAPRRGGRLRARAPRCGAGLR